MDCYTCKHRGTVPGDNHSRCNFLKGHKESAELEMLLASGTVKLTIGDKDTGKVEEMVIIDDHGRKMGWAMWPLNFDPIWIKECKFYNK